VITGLLSTAARVLAAMRDGWLDQPHARVSVTVSDRQRPPVPAMLRSLCSAYLYATGPQQALLTRERSEMSGWPLLTVTPDTPAGRTALPTRTLPPPRRPATTTADRRSRTVIATINS